MNFSFASSENRKAFSENRLLWILLSIFSFFLTYTFFATNNQTNWFLENILTVITLAALIITYKNRKLSDMSYLLIFLFLCLHVYGSKYTYVEHPIGYWLQDLFHTQRNHYDRIVHFSFGFLLAYPMREIFMNWLHLSKRLSLILPVEVTLSLSVIYELIEWIVADVIFEAGSAAFVGSQGDIWDAQKDMFLATFGAFLAILLIIAAGKAFLKEKH